MKYVITHQDGSPVDPKAIYFVLRVDKKSATPSPEQDEELAATRGALKWYAARTPKAHNAKAARATILKAELQDLKNQHHFNDTRADSHPPQSDP